VTPTTTGTGTRTPSNTPQPLSLTSVTLVEVATGGATVVHVTLRGGGFTNYDLTLTGVTLTVLPADVTWTNLTAPALQTLSLDMAPVFAYWRRVTFMVSMAAQNVSITKNMTAPAAGVVVSPARGGYGTPLVITSRAIGGGGVVSVWLVAGSARRGCVIDGAATGGDVLVCTPWGLGNDDFGRVWGVSVVDVAGASLTLAATVNVTVTAPTLRLGAPAPAMSSSVLSAATRVGAVLSSRPPPSVAGASWARLWNSTTTFVVGRGGGVVGRGGAYVPAGGAVVSCASAGGDGNVPVAVRLGNTNALQLTLRGGTSSSNASFTAPEVTALRSTTAATATSATTAAATGSVVLTGRGFVDAHGLSRLTGVTVGGNTLCTPLVVANTSFAACSWTAAVSGVQAEWRGGVSVRWRGGWVTADTRGTPLAVSSRLRSAPSAAVPAVVRGGQVMYVLGPGVGRGPAVNVSVGGVPCAPVSVVSDDAVTCLAPALVGVDIAPVSVVSCAGLASLASVNVSYLTAIEPTWRMAPPAAGAGRVVLIPAGRASGSVAAWPSPVLALMVAGVGSGTCALDLVNVTSVAHPLVYGSGLGMPATGDGSTPTLVGSVSGRVVLSSGAPALAVTFDGLGLWAGGGTSAVVAADCQDSNGKVTAPVGVWFVTTANLSASWVSTYAGNMPPTVLPRVSVALAWSGGEAPFSMAVWATCTVAVLSNASAAAAPLTVALTSVVDAETAVSVVTATPVSVCNANATAGSPPCWVYAADSVSLAAAPTNVSLALVAECVWGPTGERVRMPPQVLSVPPFATVWGDGSVGGTVPLYLGDVTTRPVRVVHAFPAARWDTAAPSCTVQVVGSSGGARLAAAATKAVYTVTMAGAVTPDVVLGMDGEPGNELTVQVVCVLWDARAASPPLTLHARVVGVAPAVPLPTRFIASDGVTPIYLSHLAFAFTDDFGEPVTSGTQCTLVSSTAGVELRMGSITLVPDADGIINVTDARVVTTLDTRVVSLLLTCSRPYGDAPAPLSWTLTAASLVATACHVPAVTVMPESGALPSLSVLVGPPGWRPAACDGGGVGGSSSGDDAEVVAAVATYVSCSVVVVTAGSWNSSTAPAASDIRNVYASPPTGGRALHASGSADGIGVVALEEVQVVGSRGAWYGVEGTCSLGNVAIPGVVTFTVHLEPCPGGYFPRGFECIMCPGSTFSYSGDAECTSCPAVGATCTSGNLTLLQHYFRPPSNFGVLPGPDMQLFGCYNNEACTLNAMTAEYGCAAGYSGNLCGVCTSGYAKFGAVCRPCWQPAYSILLLLTMVIGSVAFLTFVGLRKGGDGSVASWRPPLKMLLGFVQALSALRVFKAGGTALFQDAMGWTDTVNSSPLSSGGMQCLLQWDMLSQYVAVVLLPAAGAAACIALVMSVLAARSLRSGRCGVAFDAAAWYAAFVEWLSRKRHTATLVFLLFLGYMPIVTASFRVLTCYDHMIDGTWWLASDLSVACYRGVHAVASAIAVAVLVAYGMGFPLLIFWSLSRAPAARLRDRYFVAAYGFLYLGYRTSGAGRRDGASGASAVHALSAATAAARMGGDTVGWWSARWVRVLNMAHWSQRFTGRTRTLVWWEATILLRKGLVVLLSSVVVDPYYQVVGAVFLFAVFAQVQKRYSPYSDNAFNRLEVFMLVDLYVTAAVSTLLLPTAAQVTPETQRSNNMLSALLVVFNVFTSLLLAGTVAYQLADTLRHKVGQRLVARSSSLARTAMQPTASSGSVVALGGYKLPASPRPAVAKRAA